MEDRMKLALELSEEILGNIECEEIKLSSVLLKCVRLARIMNDEENLQWLLYESSGYPVGSNGKLLNEGFSVGTKHGRLVYGEKGEELMFTSLVSDLELQIESNMKSLPSFTTNGASVAGDMGYVAMGNLTKSVSNSVRNLRSNISDSEEKLSKLRGKYYEYVLGINMQLKFSEKIEDIFNEYRFATDTILLEFLPGNTKKLSSIYSRLSEKDEESWSQAATTCRKLLVEFSDSLFNKIYPDLKEKKIKTKNGKELDITGDKYLNRLSAILDKISMNDMKKDNILLTVAWLESINDRVCKGLHKDISYDEIRSTVLHLYILLADIITDFNKYR